MRVEDKDDLFNTVFTELKKLGVKVPKVKKFKTIVSKQEKALPQSKSKIFGVCLCDQEWTADRDFILPKFIASSIAFLRDFITVEGLFRKAGSIARQRDLRIKLENGESLDGSEPNDVASLLKQWLRELPEPLVPNYMHDLYIRCQHLETSGNRVTALLLACLLLPPDHLRTLKYLLLFLSDFAVHSDKNKMDNRNLALIIAPNIFVMGADATDKSSQDLMELYTSILETLIKNAGNIGGIPASVSFQHPALDSCSELDSSGDILDSSPFKSRKKRRSGPVQDIFNGIKKLVGQTTTPAPRSASKRKAENNDGSLPKKLTVEVNGERTSCETPKSKGNEKLLNADGKIASGRTRKKSFGLLRRKRQKSTQESPQSKVSPSSKNPFNWDVDIKTDQVNNSLQLPSPVSPFNFFDGDKALKSDSIKKSTSDRYLIVPSAKVSALFSSASQGQLQSRSKASPYNLRTKIEGCQKSQMQSLESIQLEMKEIMGHEADKHKGSNQKDISSMPPAFETLASTELISEVCKDEKVMDMVKKPESVEPKIEDLTEAEVRMIELRDRSSRKSSSRKKRNGNHGHASESMMSRNKNSENGDAKSLLSETLLQLDAKLSKSSSKVTHSSRNVKQETSNLKLQENQKIPLDLSTKHDINNMKKKSHENQPLKKDIKNNQLRKCQSVNLGNKSDSHGRNMSVRKVAEKTTRKASLIRGRPNTVKSGLPSDLCQRFNNDSILMPNSDFDENPSLLTNNITKGKEELSPRNHKEVKEPASIPNHNEKETYCSDERVSPLNLKFQYFTLSSPPTTSPINNSIPDLKSKSRTSFPIFDDSSFTQQDSKSHLATQPDASQKRKLSLPVFEEETSPGCKIPRLRKSLDAGGRKSSLKKASTDLKRKSGSSLSNENPAKIPVKCTNSLKDLSGLDISMNDSCFRTPNKIASPDSVIWMSGKKYLDINYPQNEEPFNKRESIAMILKNKSGHVQSKVHLWDTKVRESVYCTRSVPTYSTPTAAFISDETSQKQRSHSQRNRKPLSVSKSCNSAGNNKNRKPPLPPPPKFFAPESNTPSPNVNRPLKEVTNISFGMNDSKNSVNSSLSKDEFGFLDVSLENLVPKKNRRKLNRNSFAESTPQKGQKRVSRSISSPCRRPVKRASRGVKGLNVESQSPVLEDNFVVPTHRLLRSSTSKSGSCLSIEKLRSDQMTDEWQYEM